MALDTQNDKPEAILDAISIRPAHDGDFALIFNSWIEGYRYENGNHYLKRQDYKSGQMRVIERLLLRGAPVLIACLPDDSNTILGWICAERIEGVTVIHWLYVKSFARRKGIAKELAKAAGVDLAATIPCTHATHVLITLSEKYPTRFLPKLLEGGLAERSFNARSQHPQDPIRS